EEQESLPRSVLSSHSRKWQTGSLYAAAVPAENRIWHHWTIKCSAATQTAPPRLKPVRPCQNFLLRTFCFPFSKKQCRSTTTGKTEPPMRPLLRLKHQMQWKKILLLRNRTRQK